MYVKEDCGKTLCPAGWTWSDQGISGEGQCARGARSEAIGPSWLGGPLGSSSGPSELSPRWALQQSGLGSCCWEQGPVRGGSKLSQYGQE